MGIKTKKRDKKRILKEKKRKSFIKYLQLTRSSMSLTLREGGAEGAGSEPTWFQANYPQFQVPTDS